jgi:hypothetical protein
MLAERTEPGVQGRPYEEGRRYYGFTDPSGGKNDSAVLAIAHFEDGKAVLDYLREIESPHAPAHACAEFAAILKAYHIHEVTGDRYAASFVSEHYQKAGIGYRGCERTRSELYLELLPHLMSGTILLLDHPKMAAQFCGLERKPGRTKDVIDHRQGNFDDCANATAGVLVEVLQGNATGQLGLLEWEREIAGGLRRDPRLETPRKPVETQLDNFRNWQRTHRAPPCPHPDCRSTSTTYNAQRKILCNQCQRVDGQDRPQPAGECCGNFLSQRVSGMTRCGNCGHQVQDGPAIANAATFADLHARRNSFGRGSFGRFG